MVNPVVQISQADNDVLSYYPEETVVYIESVFAYWLRILKLAEKIYSMTEQKDLAGKEQLIKY